MDEETKVAVTLALIVAGALVAETPARRRGQLFARIDRDIGDPDVIPITDGERQRLLNELRSLYERLHRNWLV